MANKIRNTLLTAVAIGALLNLQIESTFARGGGGGHIGGGGQVGGGHFAGGAAHFGGAQLGFVAPNLVPFAGPAGLTLQPHGLAMPTLLVRTHVD